MATAGKGDRVVVVDEEEEEYDDIRNSCSNMHEEDNGDNDGNNRNTGGAKKRVRPPVPTQPHLRSPPASTFSPHCPLSLTAKATTESLVSAVCTF